MEVVLEVLVLLLQLLHKQVLAQYYQEVEYHLLLLVVVTVEVLDKQVKQVVLVVEVV